MIKKNLKILFIFCTIIIVLSITNVVFADYESDTDIKLVVDSVDITSLTSPVIINDRTMVPVRFIAEQLGALVEWDGATRSVLVTKGNRKVLFKIDSNLVQFNDGTSYIVSDVAPIIVNSRTLVPVRLISNAFFVNVEWDGENRTVIIDSSQASDVKEFYDIQFKSLNNGDIISENSIIDIEISDELEQKAVKKHLLLIDSKTNSGFIVDNTLNETSEFEYSPKMEDQGNKVLVVVLYDENNEFIGGVAVSVKINLEEKIILNGVSNYKLITDTIAITPSLNFKAAYLKCEIESIKTGKKTTYEFLDPEGVFYYTPKYEQNGVCRIKISAYDYSGNVYNEREIYVTVVVNRKLSLNGVSENQIISNQISLYISLNFDFKSITYIIKDILTGEEEIIETVSYGSITRFLHPSYKGNKTLYAKVEDYNNVIHNTSEIPVVIDDTPKLLLSGIGPNQVITSDFDLKVISNVIPSNVNLYIKPTDLKSEKIIIGQGSLLFDMNLSELNEGSQIIYAKGYYNGQMIISDEIKVNIYKGTTYSSKAIIEKDEFIDFASELAINSKESTGMSAALQVAQAILETGYGQYVPVDKYSGKFSYNLFGIKGTATNGYVISNTWESYNGVTYRIDDRFRAYNSIEESWNDHKQLSLKYSRYAQFRKVMYDYQDGAWAIKRAGYATDPKYPIKLMDIVNRYNLYEFDRVYF